MTTPATRPLALVTGASKGIGLELARQFAEHDFDLLIAAEDTELAAAAAQLQATGASVQTLQVDLATYEGVEQLAAAAAATGRPVAAAALNAGVGVGGPFVENDLDAELTLIQLNAVSVVHLAKRLLPAMVQRGEGRLLVTSSIASTMPGPYAAVYNASKSFVQSFSEAVRSELKDSGVTVTSLMPGPTDTEFFDRAGLDDTKLGQGPKDDPAQVAKQGYEALMAGEEKVVGGGLKSKGQAAVDAITPDSVKAAAHKVMAKPGSGE